MELSGNMEGEMGSSWDHGEGEKVRKKDFGELEKNFHRFGESMGQVGQRVFRLKDILDLRFAGEAQKPPFSSNFLDPSCA
ncbi:hypothetical protein HAX54_018209 [Datura stramonium]|uniref:Uncharacterized protein n=1 Tax=Datura stramonium TaxID=4076 RepID=A0ABS8UNJ5_DATST|nr:hypothetical protein [Datura stramonium]